MKRTLALTLLAVMLLSFSWSCEDITPTSDPPFASHTTTPTTGNGSSPGNTSNCSFTTLPETAQFASINGSCLGATPVTTLSTGPQGGGHVDFYVIKSPSDWTHFYTCPGGPAAPVDLNSQMLIIAAYNGCIEIPSFLNICSNGSQITVSVKDSINGPQCLLASTSLLLASFPNSSLPISWQFTVIPRPMS